MAYQTKHTAAYTSPTKNQATYTSVPKSTLLVSIPVGTLVGVGMLTYSTARSIATSTYNSSSYITKN